MVNGDGIIDSNDRVAIGATTRPNLVYGFGFSAKWKGLDFNAHFQGAGKSSFFVKGTTVFMFQGGDGWGNVLKEMAENDFRFENTEVCALLAGSEEAGLRGSVAYAKRHKEDLSDVETIFIAMDTMREIEQLQIYTNGCTGTQKNSNAVAEVIYEAGVNCGIEMAETELYPGAIDAEGFSRYGLMASGFCGVNHDPKLIIIPVLILLII